MSSFTARMAAGRDNAADARNRGFHTGKSAAGWGHKPPEPDRGSFDRLRAELKASFRAHWEGVLADYQYAAHGETEVPF